MSIYVYVYVLVIIPINVKFNSKKGFILNIIYNNSILDKPFLATIFQKVGLNTARSILDKDTDALLKMVDLEEETIEEVKQILKEELEG